jgi:hypothetical protein
VERPNSPLDRHRPGVSPASVLARSPAPPRIVGLEKLEGRESLALPLFCRIVALEFNSRLGGRGDDSSLRLEIMPVHDPQLRVHCFFQNVCELRLAHLPAEGLPITFFAIEAIALREWPGLHWQVGEIVSDVPDPTTGELPHPGISFYAGHAEIGSVTMV